MRSLWILIACAGCPASTDPDVELPDLPAPPDPAQPLPPSNCPRAAAPPITWCREVRHGTTEAGTQLRVDGALSIQDWTNVTAGAQGHVETLYGAGFPIERHATGTFAGEMSATCDDHGRVEIEHASYANIRTYYDLANRMRSFEWDGTKDGVYDSRAFYSYDEAGRRVREVHDHGAGMAIAVIYDYRYDARGRLEAVDADLDGDGELDLTTIHEWDDLDRRISQSTFAHQELVERWRWTYDGPRELAAEIEGDYRWTNTYDDRGRLIETESRDLVADHVDGLFQQRYDDADRLIEQLQDDGADGVIDATVAFSYDCP